MKASKFSEAQIAFVLKQAEGDVTVAEVCRKAGIAPFQHLLCNCLSANGIANARWLTKYERFRKSQFAKLALLCVLNVRSIRTNPNVAIHWLAGFHRVNAERQAALKHRIKEICETRVRFGCGRVHVMLQREGWTVNQKRIPSLQRDRTATA